MFKRILYGSAGLLILSGLLLVKVFAIQDQVLPTDGSFYDSAIIQQMKSNLTIVNNLTVGNAITATSANVTSVTIGQQNVTGISASGAITGQNLTARNSLTVNTNAIIGGTVDAAAFTVDAGAGLDNQAAGALLLGAATATSVEIADADVPTDIQGTLSVDQNAMFDAAVTALTVRVNGILALENGEYFSNVQDTYIKVSGHLVSLGDGTFNLGSSTQEFGYGYFKNEIAMQDATIRNSLIVGTNATFSALTASYPVFTDGSKILISKKIYNGDVSLTNTVTPQVVTPTATVTVEAPSAHTPTITVTPETGAVTASGANDLVTPTATMTPETGAVTASGANNLATITATMTFQTTVAYDSTGVALTNAAGDNILFVTNGTCAITPDVPTNAVVSIIVTGGDAVWTNATCAITPDLASNTVVVVSVTGGDAVWTNAAAASSALPLFATNATCAITPDLMTNAIVTCP